MFMAYFWTPCNVLSLVIILSIRSFTQCKNRVMWPAPPVMIIDYFVAGKFNISHFKNWPKLCETLCFAVHHSGHSSWHFVHLLLGSSVAWPSSSWGPLVTVRRNIEGKGQSEGAGSFLCSWWLRRPVEGTRGGYASSVASRTCCKKINGGEK